MMITGSVHKRRDKDCLGYFLAKMSRKIWKHSVSGAGIIRIRRKFHHLGLTAQYKIDVFTNELGGDLQQDADRSPAR